MGYEQIAIPIFAGLSVASIAGALVAVRAARRAPVRARLGLRDALDAAPENIDAQPLAGFAEQVGALATADRASLSLREQLTQAGYHDQGAASIYIGAKLLLLLLALAGSTAVVVTLSLSLGIKALIVIAAALVMFFLPNLVVQMRRARRSAEVHTHLPDAVDLLEICTASGMGLDTAWNSVADEVREVSGILADEMALTNLEMHLGASRAAAMRHMARRTRVDELSTLVAVLVQSERFGTSVVQALHTFASTLREIRNQRAQESAEKMAVKILVPLVLFIFPAVVLVIIGPALMSLYKATAAH